jgi:signal transduction histidine kinase/ActR/RegA family two-component response regulator
VPLERGSAGRLLKSGEVCHVLDMAGGPPHALAVVDEGLEGGSLATLLVVVLEAHGEKLGALCFGARFVRGYGRDDVEMATEFASRLSLALKGWDDVRRLYRTTEELRKEVAERKQAEEALRKSEEQFHRLADSLQEADRRKDEFLAMLAHELRNPLAPISNAVQIMKREGPAGPNYAWSVDVIADQVKQMIRMVDDLLDVSRITRGTIRLLKERVELAWIVDQAVETSRPLFDERKHELTISLPTEPIFLEADPARLAQVISNLLNNAAKYTQVGGRMLLSAEKTLQEVVVRVRDNGIGISAEMLPKVFDLFAQVQQSLDRSEGGLGIGLTLVRYLVEMHGGTVTARSDGTGRGSEFEMRLPLVTEPQKRDIPKELAEVDISPTPCRRILVVDDHQKSAQSLATVLRAAGHEVTTAFDGSSALELARTFHPEVILLDIGLPGMDGYEVGRRLRLQPGFEQPLVVAVSGYGKDEDKRHSREAGFKAHLVKPVDLAALHALLAHPEYLAAGRNDQA